MDQGQKNAAIAMQAVLIQQAKAERTEEVLAIIDEMFSERTKAAKDFGMDGRDLTLMTNLFYELKTRIKDASDD